MARHGAADVVESGEARIAVQYLEAVRGELAAAKVNLIQYGGSYYFREADRGPSLAATPPQMK